MSAAFCGLLIYYTFLLLYHKCNLCGCEPTLIISLEVFYLKLKQLWTHLYNRCL